MPLNKLLNDAILKEAKKRQKVILNTMVKNGYISKKEANNAYKEELVFYGKKEKLNLK